jgi:nucleoid-associated protein YgaU
MTGRWRLLAWTATLAIGLRALHALGAGTMSIPMTSGQELSAWLDRTPPEVMALALVRLVALAAGWYLSACTLALALTRPFGRTRVTAAVARATPGVLGRLVSGGGSLGLAAGTLLGALPSLGVVPAPLAPMPAAASASDPLQNPGPETATMTRGAQDAPTAAMTRLPAEQPLARPAPTPDRSTAAAFPSSWTVAAGDSFWLIAAQTVSPAKGEPSDDEVLGYWRRLVEANTSLLLDPGNPDLLVPGQELLLPDPLG